MRFVFIDAEKGRFSVDQMCELLNVSRSGYYAWRERRGQPDRRRRANEAELRKAIKAAAKKGRGRYGRGRILVQLRRKGFGVGTERLQRIMAEEGLRGKGGPSRRRKPIAETAAPASPNLLERDFVAKGRDQIWTGDITQLPTTGHPVYVAVVLDLFARPVVGLAGMLSCGAELVVAAMQEALRRRQPPPGLIFHSDQGSQYRSDRFRRLLRVYGVVQSMSRRGNCLDNAPTESFFATLKRELGDELLSPAETITRVRDYCERFYNTQRLHSSLNYMTPRDFEKANAA